MKRVINVLRKVALAVLVVVGAVGYVTCKVLGTLEFAFARKLSREPKLPQYWLIAMDWMKKKIKGKEVQM